ncbi:MAG: ATP-binding protein [Acidobacteriota bacterium]|nr:ATP-binding protein [Acidobacteriota bacterium]
MRQTLSDIDHDISRIVRDLRPGSLLNLGLASAVRAYVDEWSHHSAVSCDFHSNGGPSLPVLVETTIYRIVQEALTNVARHARAQRASVVIVQHDSCLTAIVEDDGVGFEPTARAAASDGRLGLIGMRERAALLGGTCTIESRAGAGTSVFVKIPLRDRGTPHLK